MVRSRSLRARLARACAYVLLVSVAAIVVFPFLVAVTTAFKRAEDVQRYPPSLVPREPRTVASETLGLQPAGLEGVDPDDPFAKAAAEVARDQLPERLPLYELPGRDGRWALVEAGVSVTIVVDPADPTRELAVSEADVVGETGRSVTVDGEERPLLTVTVDGVEQEAARLRSATANVYQALDGPEERVTALDAVPLEQFGLRTQNFSDVMRLNKLGRSLTNTVLVTALVVVGQCVTSILGGYAFARLRFRGRDKLFLLYLASVMIPFVVLVIPLFQLMVQLGWRDNLVSLVVPFIFTAYGTFLMRQFFLGIPTEIEEAALIDGASRNRILWQLFVPLARPAIASLATFGFLYAWNSFVWPFVIINSGNPDSFVLSLSLAQLGGRSASDVQLAFAGATIAMTPPILVFLFAQRYFVSNAASSGLK